jgi:hypothetical protein
MQTSYLRACKVDYFNMYLYLNDELCYLSWEFLLINTFISIRPFLFSTASLLSKRLMKRATLIFWRNSVPNSYGLSTIITTWSSSLTRVHYGFDPRQRQTIFPVASVSRPALGPTQPPVQWVRGVLSSGVKRGRGVMLTTHLILCWGQEWVGTIPPSPPWRLYGVAGHLFFTTVQNFDVVLGQTLNHSV